jgi:hypothetical protein
VPKTGSDYSGAAIIYFREDVMLSLQFSRDDYAFVYSEGRPIGAILIGAIKGRSRLSLLFGGQPTDFEILRPSAVEGRYGIDELERLRSRFLSLLNERETSTIT